MQPHLKVMHAFAYRLTGSHQDAEDLVQDVVVKLYPKLDELESVEQLRPWLNRVLYRQFIDSVRKKNRQADRPVSDLMAADSQSEWLDTLESDSQSPELELNQTRLGPMLDKALAQLSPDQRTLLLLHDVDGWRQEDVAEVLGVPVGTVKSRLHRCRANLRNFLQECMEPEPGSGRQEL
ncbi:RNA polymerase sigma factor [Marinobacter sp. SS5-14b]|uniref:RNA polymerase sigma factor n=1 Tax=Marinobacter sp. SS5-14b TaxID=3050456 RepID=UPI0026DF1265|nr:RNA polymerase sigma factor [Marinobacter sp. SS5-14b]